MCRIAHLSGRRKQRRGPHRPCHPPAGCSLRPPLWPQTHHSSSWLTRMMPLFLCSLLRAAQLRQEMAFSCACPKCVPTPIHAALWDCFAASREACCDSSQNFTGVARGAAVAKRARGAADRDGTVLVRASLESRPLSLAVTSFIKLTPLPALYAANFDWPPFPLSVCHEYWKSRLEVGSGVHNNKQQANASAHTQAAPPRGQPTRHVVRALALAVGRDLNSGLFGWGKCSRGHPKV